jgi:hypothetical protein
VESHYSQEPTELITYLQKSFVRHYKQTVSNCLAKRGAQKILPFRWIAPCHLLLTHNTRFNSISEDSERLGLFPPFSSPPSRLRKISHPLRLPLKMLGATLIKSKNAEEDCSLRKASNRLVLSSSLRYFFCLWSPISSNFFRIISRFVFGKYKYLH